jgi:hypothetical protein
VTPGGEHQPRDHRRGLFLHRRDGVGVPVQAARDGGVAEPLGDDLEVDVDAPDAVVARGAAGAFLRLGDGSRVAWSTEGG